MPRHVHHNAGHGGKDSGAVNPRSGVKEKDVVLQVALKVGALLDGAGIKNSYTRTTDTFVSLNGICAKANATGADFFVSYHLNAFNSSAHGTESFTYNGERYAIAVKANENLASNGWRNRGIKAGNHLAVINGTRMPAMLIEICFVDNDNDMKILNEKGLDKIALDIAKAIEPSVSGDKVGTAPSSKSSNSDGKLKNVYMLNIDYPKVSVAQMKQWAKNRGANQLFIDLADTFYDEGMKAHVNPAVLYALSAKETNFMKFGGVIDASYCNPCGMKTTQGGGDYDKNAHHRFKDWKEGIQAHAHHIALYAGHARFPRYNPNVPNKNNEQYKANGTTPDPRHFDFIYNTARNVLDLNGKYATPSAQTVPYGTSVLNYINELIATPYTETEPVSPKDAPKAEEHWAYPFVEDFNRYVREHNEKNPDNPIKGISELRLDEAITRGEAFKLFVDTITMGKDKK